MNKLFSAIAVVTLVLSLWTAVSVASLKGIGADLGATAAGGLLVENYIPAIMYNNGYQSAKDISTTADLYSADLYVSDDATVSGGSLAVTTAANATSTIVVGGIQTYATSSATSICLFFSTLGATSTFQGTTYWRYGSAPCQL